MFRKLFFPLLLSLAIMLTAPLLWADEPTVEVKLSKNSFSINQGVLLTVTVTGSRSAEIIMPEVDGLIFHNRGTSTMINMINGDFTSSSTSKYIIQATREGKFTIPPIEARVKRKIYKSRPLNITVYSSIAASKGKAVSSGQNREEIAFIEMELENEYYIGQQVPVIVRGYFDSRYKISLESPPTLTGDGVIMAPFTEQPSQTREQIAGRIYDVVDWQTNLTAIKEGEHEIQLSLGAAVYTREKSSNPFDDPFFDSFFNNTRKTPLEVTSPPLTFKTLPLPTENKPKNFHGAIGNFTIHVEADPIIVDPGEPVTVTTTITGEGNFDSVHAPVFTDNKDWKTYKPATIAVNKEEKKRKKVFQQVIIPKNDSLKEIPALSFSYFNPVKKVYETNRSKPVAIHVKPGKENPAIEQQTPSTAIQKPVLENSKPTVKTKGIYTNLVPQHLETGSFTNKIEPLFKKSWFMAAVIICLLMIIMAAIFHLFFFFKGNDKEKKRRKKQQKLAVKDLSELDKLRNSEERGAFLQKARKTVQHYYSLEFNLEPKAITPSTLAAKGLQKKCSYQILVAADGADFGGKELDQSEINLFFKQLQEEISR